VTTTTSTTSRTTTSERKSDRELIELKDELRKYAPQPLTLQRLASFGQRPDELQAEREAVEYLRQEVPVRIAHMSSTLDSLPAEVLALDRVAQVQQEYLVSMDEISRVGASDLRGFRRTLRRVIRRHAPAVLKLSAGMLEYADSQKEAYVRQGGLPECWDDDMLENRELIDRLLDRFFLGRIGTRVLMSQHLELFRDDDVPGTGDDGWIGLVDPQCKPSEVIEQAIDSARFLVLQNYGDAPEINVAGSRQSIDCTISYIPTHLYHIAFELLKNALRATMETAADAVLTGDYPPVTVVLSKGQDDLSFKIGDQGGGIPRNDMHKLFSYFYTTAPRPQVHDGDNVPDMNNAPLAGFGYGLPVSRLYARYVGGDVRVISLDGYGTDAFVYLKLGSRSSREQVPWTSQ
jgi:pyruvate dehydrogenase kinase 2/3/4